MATDRIGSDRSRARSHPFFGAKHGAERVEILGGGFRILFFDEHAYARAGWLVQGARSKYHCNKDWSDVTLSW